MKKWVETMKVRDLVQKLMKCPDWDCDVIVQGVYLTIDGLCESTNQVGEVINAYMDDGAFVLDVELDDVNCM